MAGRFDCGLAVEHEQPPMVCRSHRDCPGRAGGGEELGGLRAVTHYLQRAAVQVVLDRAQAAQLLATARAARTAVLEERQR